MQAVTEISTDLFHSVPIGLSIMEGNGRIVDANPFFCDSEGVFKKNIIGKTLLELGFITFEESISLSHAISSGGGIVSEFDVSGTFHQKKVIAISVSPYRLNNNEYYLYTYKDKTEHTRTEQRLKEKLNSLENITNHLPAMIYNYCRTDQGDMYFDYVSKGSIELLGYPPEELLKDFSILWESIHPEDLTGLMETIHSSAETNLNWHHEYRLRHRDGTYRWVQGRATPFKRDKGAVSWIGAVMDISDRKQIELEKKQLEDRLYHSIEYTPNLAIQWYNKEGKVIYWNKASERLYGYLSNEAIGKTLDQLIYSAEEADGFLATLNQIRNTGEPIGPFESYIKNKEGETRAILASTYMIPGSDADPVFVCMDYDISEQKEAQSALIKSEERLRAITSVMLDVVWILNKEDIIIYKSRDADILDQTLNSNIKTSHVHPDDLGNVQQALVRLKNNPFGQDRVEYRAFEGDGCMRYLETFGTNQYENPAIQGLVLITRNITERKQAENEIRNSHLFLETLLNSIPVHVSWKDLQSRYLGANRLFLDIIGLPNPNHIIGKSDEEFFGKTHGDSFIEKDREIIENGRSYIFYEDEIERNGQLHWILKSKVPLKDPENNIIGVLVTGQDITERKIAEQKLKNKNEELVKINSELDRFVYSASHDLRAPIASVMGLIEVLKMESRPEMISVYLEKQKKSLKKMDDFIQEIVHFSRNGRLDIVNEEVDLKFLVEEIFEQYSYLEKAHLIDTKVEIIAGGSFVSDRQRINVILSNLISNSIKYADTDKKNPYLQVHIEITPDKAEIMIEDNGEGIPDQYKEKIYDMFFRATVNSTGSGIGLYIVKEVVTKLNGEIDLSSEEGLGTCFRVTIPNKK